LQKHGQLDHFVGIGSGIGSIVGGIAYERFGPLVVFLATCVLVVLSATVFLLTYRPRTTNDFELVSREQSSEATNSVRDIELESDNETAAAERQNEDEEDDNDEHLETKRLVLVDRVDEMDSDELHSTALEIDDDGAIEKNGGGRALLSSSGTIRH
jgi:hypothetical protein